MADVLHVVCGVCPVGKWLAGGLYKNIGVIAALWCSMFSLKRKRYV